MALGYKLTHDKLTPAQMRDPQSRWTGGELGYVKNGTTPNKTTFHVTVKPK